MPIRLSYELFVFFAVFLLSLQRQLGLIIATFLQLFICLKKWCFQCKINWKCHLVWTIAWQCLPIAAFFVFFMENTNWNDIQRSYLSMLGCVRMANRLVNLFIISWITFLVAEAILSLVLVSAMNHTAIRATGARKGIFLFFFTLIFYLCAAQHNIYYCYVSCASLGLDIYFLGGCEPDCDLVKYSCFNFCLFFYLFSLSRLHMTLSSRLTSKEGNSRAKVFTLRLLPRKAAKESGIFNSCRWKK